MSQTQSRVEELEFLKRAEHFTPSGKDFAELLLLLENRRNYYQMLFAREEMQANAEVLATFKEAINRLNERINKILFIRVEK